MCVCVCVFVCVCVLYRGVCMQRMHQRIRIYALPHTEEEDEEDEEDTFYDVTVIPRDTVVQCIA